jgi:flagellar basal body-associated protein FliL
MCAAPLKPKDPKPLVEEEAQTNGGSSNQSNTNGGGMDLKFIITLVVIVLSNVLCIGGAIYFLAPMVLVPAITAQLPKAEAGGEEGEAEEGEAGGGEHGEAGATKGPHHQSIGLTYPLEEFTVNLKTSTPNANTFARLKLALNVGVPPAEDCLAVHEAKGKEGEHKPAEGGGEGGGHGAPPPAAPGEDPCMKAFSQKMAPFLPTIRDIVNSSLMKRQAAELSSPEGQEAFKDDVKEQVDHVIGSQKYSVQRINFEDFIIQR